MIPELVDVQSRQVVVTERQYFDVGRQVAWDQAETFAEAVGGLEAEYHDDRALGMCLLDPPKNDLAEHEDHVL